MIPQPPMVGDRPLATHLHGKLKDKRVLGHVDRRYRCIGRRWQNLHARSCSAPSAGHAKAAEAAIAPNFHGSHGLDLPNNLIPLRGIEGEAWFDGDELVVFIKGEFDTTP